MTTSLQNGDIKAGYKSERQHRSYLKFASCLCLIGFMSALYELRDLSSMGYIEIIRRTEQLNLDRSSVFTYINTTEIEKKEGYLVWSPSCRIPDITPFHESIKKFIKKESLPRCGSLLSRIVRTGEDHVLTTTDKSLACCYSLITRKDVSPHATKIDEPDNVFSVGDCKSFKTNVTFSKDEQFIKIKCTKKGKGKKEVYKNMHAFVRKTKSIVKKIKDTKSKLKKPSVLIVGIDSISRLNLVRTMPKTVDYLKREGWLELNGYNKMGDNTFPNLMAILTGQTPEQLAQSCWPTPKNRIDNCPLIWKDFSKAGYVTVYAEDEPTIGTFNFHKTGFVHTPTDYYLRPFMLAAEKFMKTKSAHGLNVCLGPTPTDDHIFDYAVDFATTFQNDTYFGLFWMNSFSHQSINTPSAMDGRVLSFFETFKKTGALNTAIILFISDHGMRFGKIRETYVGWLEERLPFVYFWIPDYYKRLYPGKYRSLQVNADRLTSPFDVHVTLRNILEINSNGTEGCTKCQSLFDEVPWNRSCSDAGVTEHWCTCAEYKTLSTESAPIRSIARFVLDHINKEILDGSKYLTNGTQCSTLKINRILSVRSKIFSRTLGHDEFVILFETVPGEAIFEATVAHKSTFQLMDTVSRLNAYGGQSRCMDHAYLKKYCFCEKH